MNRDARIRRLPLALAIGLRLHEAGAADALIAVGLGIEPEGVPPVLELAKAKLVRLETGRRDETETGPDSRGSVRGGSDPRVPALQIRVQDPDQRAGDLGGHDPVQQDCADGSR